VSWVLEGRQGKRRFVGDESFKKKTKKGFEGFILFNFMVSLGGFGGLNIKFDNFTLTIIQNSKSFILSFFKLLIKLVPKNNNYELKGNIIFVYIVKLIYHYCITF